MRYAILMAALVSLAPGQTSSLVIHTDLDCRVTIDGESKGVLKTTGSLRLDLVPGEHRLEAAPLDGGPHWQGSVEVSEEERSVTIPLRAFVDRAEAERLGYWIEPDTKLMWAAQDNGSAVTYRQAALYCRTLTLGGFTDWTLPAIDALQKLFGGPANASGYRITAPIKLTGWEWSSSPGTAPGEEWALDFGDGGRASVVMGDSGFNRALCVRRAE